MSDRPQEDTMSDKEWQQVLGPLAPLFEDPDVQEIMVDAPDRVLVERAGQLQETAVRFASAEVLHEVITAILAAGGVTRGSHETIGDVRLPDGASRMLAVLPPTALRGPYLVLRKFMRAAFGWDQLIDWGFITREALDLLQGALRAHVNMLITGGVGSGKTTVANLLAGRIAPEERLVIVEPVHELHVEHPRAIFLEAGGPAHVPQEELISTGSKMRPDWLIVGELYTSAALRALEVLSRGHTGMATMHASSPEDALARLESLCLMANLGLGLLEIRALIASAIRLITYQERLPTGKRRMMQLVEVAGLENDRYVLHPLFRYDPETDRLEATGHGMGWG
jgi:pilus assembly protein CpaF